MTDVLAEFAPPYWAANLPVIPLWPGKKRPALLDWTRFCREMPDEETRRGWLRDFPNGNMGLPLGPASGMVAFDIDTTNGELIQVIESFLPPAVWKRTGAKGYVSMFRYSGEKTFQIKDGEQKVICELLADGRQVVLPPSIHPDTQQPYSANTDLLAVAAQLPVLPAGFEDMLRGALVHAGVRVSTSGRSRLTEWAPSSSRDNAYTSACGTYALSVLRGERCLLDAIQEVRHWPLTFTEQVAGDNVDPEKGVKNLIAFLLRDIRDKGWVLPHGWDKGLTAEDLAALGVELTIEEQERTFDEILSEMRQGFDTASTEESKLAVIDTVAKRIARSERGLDPTQIEVLLKATSQYSGLKISIATLKASIKKLKNRRTEGTNHNEIADKVAEDFETLRYHQDKFWIWTGAHWAEKGFEDLKRHVADNFGDLPVCKRDSDYAAVVKTLQTKVTKPLADLAVDGMNFANGFLRGDGQLVAHHQSFGMNYYLPYRYMPELAGGEHAPKFFKLLKDSWGDDPDYAEKVAALQEAICATLLGRSTKLARAVLLYGLEHTGKSVVLKIVTNLMPDDRVSAVAPEDWGDKFAPAQLAGKLLNIGGELHEKKLIDGRIFKQIVVGELISAQHKNQPIFKMSATCAHWFASNHLPKSDDTSGGFFRRWLILEFNKQVPEKERNLFLAEEILTEEREAIVAWATGAIDRLNRTSCYTLPPSHDALIQQMVEGQDTVSFFLHKCPQIRVGPSSATPGQDGASTSSSIQAQQVYGAYHSFCASTGARPVGLVRFLSRMRELSRKVGFSEVIQNSDGISQVLGYSGLMLVTAPARSLY